MVGEGFPDVRGAFWPEPQRSKTVTKARLIEAVQKGVYGIKPWEARRLVERVLEIISDTLARGEDVLISGFGKFAVREKRPRQGRNPQTGAEILLRERRVVVFKTASTLRRRLNPTSADLAHPAVSYRRR